MDKRITYSALLGLIFLAGVTDTAAQVDESPIRIFGYFQTQFNQYDGNPQQEGATNTFLLQQLNIFLQKDLSEDFVALVDMEVLNTFSTSEATGALNMEEAWVRYRAGRGFNVKVGLQIPIFNHLNTIKNQTPVLPYVTRPFIYEESFDQLASLDEFVPARAFAQVFGTLPTRPLRLDYALFVGNSPNVRSNDDLGQSGVDTTNTVMLGGRVGLRVQALKVGISATHETVNQFQFLADFTPIPRAALTGIPRIRLGVDLRYSLGPVTFEGEYIRVDYDEDIAALNINKSFYYGTLRWLFKDRLTLYATYWVTREHRNRPLPGTQQNRTPMAVPAFVAENKVPSFGVAYDLRDRVVLKAQYTRINRSTDNPNAPTGPGFNIYSLAVSVFF